MEDERQRGGEEGEKDKETETAGDQIGKSENLVHLFPVSPLWSRNIPSSRCEGARQQQQQQQQQQLQEAILALP
jgi:hypothetical protein